MTFLPANDATGQSFLPGKNVGVHDLVSCQPSTSDPLKSRAPSSTSNLGKSCTLPRTSILWKSRALQSTSVLWKSRALKSTSILWKSRALQSTSILWKSRALQSTSILRKFRAPTSTSERCREIRATQNFARKLCSRAQLEHVVSFLHCKFGRLKGHLEQVPYAHALWRAQL